MWEFTWKILNNLWNENIYIRMKNHDCMPFFLISCLHLHLEYQSICLWVHRLCFHFIHSSFFPFWNSLLPQCSQWKCVLSMPSLIFIASATSVWLFCCFLLRSAVFCILFCIPQQPASQFMTHEPPLIINFCGKCVCFYPYLYMDCT